MARAVSPARRLIDWVLRRPAPVRAMAMIYGVAGAMCLFAAAFPISPNAPVTLVTVVGIGLLISSPLLLRFGAALPSWGLPTIAVTGTVVNTVLVASCAPPYGAALNSFAYLWIGIYAGQFFAQRVVRLQCAVIVVGSGVGLWL